MGARSDRSPQRGIRQNQAIVVKTNPQVIPWEGSSPYLCAGCLESEFAKLLGTVGKLARSRNGLHTIPCEEKKARLPLCQGIRNENPSPARRPATNLPVKIKVAILAVRGIVATPLITSKFDTTEYGYGAIDRGSALGNTLRNYRKKSVREPLRRRVSRQVSRCHGVTVQEGNTPSSAPRPFAAWAVWVSSLHLAFPRLPGCAHDVARWLPDPGVHGGPSGPGLGRSPGEAPARRCFRRPPAARGSGPTRHVPAVAPQRSNDRRGRVLARRATHQRRAGGVSP